jgi:cation:H+ antiporter
MVLFLLLGLLFLYFGASWLVKGSSNLALLLGISPLLIGLTVVAFGTSSPEVLVTIVSATHNQMGITFGNLIGSNIFHSLFVLGLSALINPLKIHKQILEKELLIVIGISLFLLLLCLKGSLGKWDGVLLITIGIIYWIYLILHGKKGDLDVEEIKTEKSITLMITQCLFGLLVLDLGAEMVVNQSIAIANTFGISTFVIGLTIVAIGTSLPELATSVIAAYKKESDIAVGNIIGSNVLNITFILGLGCLLSPQPLLITHENLVRDLPILVLSLLITFPIVYIGKKIISRLEGLFLITLYLIYLAVVIL